MAATKLTLNDSAIKVRFRAGEQAGLKMLADLAASRIRGSMYAPKSGVKYPDLPAVSSAPGEAPAVQSGTLEESIKSQLTDAHTSAVWAEDPKAPYLEFGTATIAARPSFGPAFEAAKQDGPEIFSREVKKALS